MFPSYSEHLALASISVSMQGQRFLLSFLCSVLRFIPPPRLINWILCCSRRSLSRQAVPSSQSEAGIMCLCCPLSCLIFLPSVWNAVLFLLLTQTSNLFAVFWKCIKQRGWHQQAFHWLLKKRELWKLHAFFFFLFFFCNELLYLSATYWHSLTQTDNISNITNTATASQIDPFDWSETKEKCSILNRAVSHQGVSTVFGKIKEKAVLLIANGFNSSPISVLVSEKNEKCSATPDLRPCL